MTYMYRAYIDEPVQSKFAIKVERWEVFEESEHMYWITRAPRGDVVNYTKEQRRYAVSAGIVKHVYKHPGRRSKFRESLEAALYSLDRRVAAQMAIIFEQIVRAQTYLNVVFAVPHGFSEEEYMEGVALSQYARIDEDEDQNLKKSLGDLVKRKNWLSPTYSFSTLTSIFMKG